MKIMISGVSGAGKTTLAKWISDTFNIPFVIGSTKVFWKQFGIKDHKELILKSINDIDFGLEFQYKCLQYRKEEMSKHKRFVSDRGVLDNIVYFISQISPFVSESITEDYINLANQFLKDNPDCITLMLDIPPTIHEDKARIINSYYQDSIHAIFQLTLARYLLTNNIHYINTWKWSDRVRETLNILFKYA